MTYQPPQQPYQQNQPYFPGQQVPQHPYGPPAGAPPFAPAPPPKSPKKRALIVSAVIVVGVICLFVATAHSGGSGGPKAQVVDSAAAGKAAADATKTKASSNFDLKPGTTVKVKLDDGTLQITVKSLTSRKSGCGDYPTPPEKGVFVIADISELVTAGTVDVNPLDFGWVGDDGTTAIMAALTDCEKSVLDSANGLREGQKRARQIVFDVASDKGSVEYTPSRLDSAQASWKK